MNLIRAEWTKLWTVRRWVLGIVAAGFLTVGLSTVAAAGSGTDINQSPTFVVGPNGRPAVDELSFAHQPLSGDGAITAQVVSQKDSNESAGAGVMIKESLQSGSRYVALYLTPKHGVQMQADFSTDINGSNASGSRWLKLARTGNTITGYESDNGSTWTEVGKVTVTMPSATQIGFFVNSPPVEVVTREAGSVGFGLRPTFGEASFDNVKAAPVSGEWQLDEVVIPGAPPDGRRFVAELTGEGSEFKLTGTGRIGPNEPADDVIQISLFGILAGLIALGSVGALYMTAEYKRGMIRTTFALSPRRGQVLAAKAVVLGVTSFVLAVLASIAAILVAGPLLRDHGFGPPAFVTPSLLDGAVIRAILLTGVFAAAVALLSLSLGAILRHSAGAISTVIALVILPAILSTLLGMKASVWLLMVTPAAGFATQRTKPPTDTLAEAWSMISPWTGLAVVCTYAVVALTAAWILQRRRDA